MAYASGNTLKAIHGNPFSPPSAALLWAFFCTTLLLGSPALTQNAITLDYAIAVYDTFGEEVSTGRVSVTVEPIDGYYMLTSLGIGDIPALPSRVIQTAARYPDGLFGLEPGKLQKLASGEVLRFSEGYLQRRYAAPCSLSKGTFARCLLAAYVEQGGPRALLAFDEGSGLLVSKRLAMNLGGRTLIVELTLVGGQGVVEELRVPGATLITFKLFALVILALALLSVPLCARYRIL